MPYPLPFKYQVEERIVYSENEKGVKTATDTIFLKYRNENMLFSVGMPYKYTEQQNSQADGFGDASALVSLICKIETSKMLFVYPTCFNSQRAKAFLIVLKNPSTPCALAQGS